MTATSFKYHLRIESPRGYSDIVIWAESLPHARERAQHRYPEYQRWDWRGAVAFAS